MNNINGMTEEQLEGVHALGTTTKYPTVAESNTNW